KVRNADGDMVPLGAVADLRDSAGPAQVIRYNMFPAAAINGASLPGMSSGDVIATMEGLARRELPQSMATEWSDLSFLQKQSSKIEQLRDLQQNPITAFILGSILVFFVLAGLYENWSLPLAVILVVPMCLLSGLFGICLTPIFYYVIRRFSPASTAVNGAPAGRESLPHRTVILVGNASSNGDHES